MISTDSIPAGLTADALAQWRAARDALVGASSLLGIGDHEEGPAVFGEITDAAIDGAGNILVLDRQAVRVSVACMDHPARLAYAFRYAPQVRLFELEGSLLWNAALTDYTPIEISTSPGSVSMSLTDDYDLLVSIHGTPSGHLILQYAHRRAGNDSHLRTYLVDAATGSGALVSRDLPSIKFIGPDSYIAAFADPYPRIEVREVDGWEG